MVQTQILSFLTKINKCLHWYQQLIPRGDDRLWHVWLYSITGFPSKAFGINFELQSSYLEWLFKHNSYISISSLIFFSSTWSKCSPVILDLGFFERSTPVFTVLKQLERLLYTHLLQWMGCIILVRSDRIDVKFVYLLGLARTCPVCCEIASEVHALPLLSKWVNTIEPFTYLLQQTSAVAPTLPNRSKSCVSRRLAMLHRAKWQLRH